jgi:hypothetical protein
LLRYSVLNRWALTAQAGSLCLPPHALSTLMMSSCLELSAYLPLTASPCRFLLPFSFTET